jgi:hypothetical protein
MSDAAPEPQGRSYTQLLGAMNELLAILLKDGDQEAALKASFEAAARGFVDDIAVIGEIAVIAGAAIHRVVIGAAIERVVASAAIQRVGAGVTFQIIPVTPSCD